MKRRQWEKVAASLVTKMVYYKLVAIKTPLTRPEKKVFVRHNKRIRIAILDTENEMRKELGCRYEA